MLEPAKPPQAQPKSIHAAEKWPVVDPPLRKQTVEAFAKGQLANPKPHFPLRKHSAQMRKVFSELTPEELRGLEAALKKIGKAPR